MGAAGGTGGRYIVDMVWTSHGGQVLATMGQIQGGMRGVGTAAGASERSLMGWNRQLAAIQTTLRYFVAGGAVYGAMNAFRQFADFQSKLGDISAISPGLTSNQITGIGDALLRQSSAMATPVGELEESARNIQSTLQGLDPKQITTFTEMFAQGARIAESDAYSFGNAIMGMRNAFGLGLGDMQRISGEFFTTIQRSAGMTGDEWAKFSGRVVAGAVQAGASLEEMNALMILGTRQGGTAATNARHMAQFLMQLRNPTQEATPFWTQIGLPPSKLQTMPFDAIMAKLNAAIIKRGGIGANKFTDEQLMAAEELGPEATAGQLGIKGGATPLIMKLFGRMESRRMASVIFSQINKPSTPGSRGFQDLLKDLQDSKKQIDANDQAMDRWLRRNRIQQFGTSLRNLMTEVLNPFEKKISGIMSGLSDLIQRPEAPKAVTGALAVGGAAALLRYGRRALPFMRGAGAAGVALTQGAAPPTGSFSNPFWVMIHPLSGGGGIGSRVPGVPPTTPGGSGPGLLGRIGRGVVKAAPLATAGGVGLYAAPVAIGAMLGPTEGGRYAPGLATLAHRRAMAGAGGGMGAAWGSIMHLSGQAGPAAMGLRISADISEAAKKLLNINIQADDGRKRVHVPVGHNAWQGGARPTFRGQNGSPRANP